MSEPEEGIKTTETLVLKESFEYCPYIRAMQKESRRNAVIQDDERRMQTELETDIPETTRLKAHLKRRVERQTKQKWVQYATEYASEIVMASTTNKNEIRNYMDMVKESVMEMDTKDRERKALKKKKKQTRNLRYAQIPKNA